MTATLVKGANASLAGANGEPRRLLVGVSWANAAADVDLCALMCTEERKVVTDQHFLFWDNPMSPALDTFLAAVPQASPAPGADRAQMLVDLAEIETGDVANFRLALDDCRGSFPGQRRTGEHPGS